MVSTKSIQGDLGGVAEKPLERLRPEEAIKMKLADIGLRRIQKVLLIQPLQIPVDEIDIRIARNRRYYTYPPYALGILNSVLKKESFTSSILDLNIRLFSKIRYRCVP